MQDNDFFEKNEPQAEEIPLGGTAENEIGEETAPQPAEPIPPQPQIKYVSYIPYGFTPKTYEEKKGIRKAANTMSVALLALIGISLLWGTVFMYLMMSLGFSYESINKIIEDPAVLQVMQIFLSSFMFTVPFIACYKFANYRISDLVSFKKPKKGIALPLFLMGLGFCSFANVAISYAGYIFESFGINYDVDYGDNPEGFFGFMLTFISTAIVPALVEEFACRGLMLGSLKKYGEGFSILASSILFGIMHGNFEQMPFAFLVGLILGFVAVKSGSLQIAILIHSANNFVSVFFDYFMNDLTRQSQNIIYTFYLCISMLLGILGACMLKTKDSDCFSFAPADTESNEKQKNKFYFTTPLIIIYIVISFLKSLIYLK